MLQFEKKCDENQQSQILLLLAIVIELFEIEKMVLEQMFSFRKRVLEAQRNKKA